MRPRDTQRNRVYKAEWEMDEGGQKIATKDLQKWVDAALDRRPIRSRWGRKTVEVRLGRGGGQSSGYGVIWLGVWGRNPLTVCHELAHELTPARYAAHGPEFAGILLFVVGTVMGPEAKKRLLALHRKHKVRRSNAAIPAVRESVPQPRDAEKRAKARKVAAERAQQIRRWVRDGQITRVDVERAARGQLSRWEEHEQAKERAAAEKRQAEWRESPAGRATLARLGELDREAG